MLLTPFKEPHIAFKSINANITITIIIVFIIDAVVSIPYYKSALARMAIQTALGW